MYKNPFDTKNCNFQLSLKTQYKNLKYFEDFLDFAADSVSISEIKSSTIEPMPEDLWLIDAFFETDPAIAYKAKIEQIAREHGIKTSELIISQVEDKDWVTEVQKNFLPFVIGKFIIASKFYEEEAKSTKLDRIIINPSRAFGTGEHQTTKACINILESLGLERDFENIADIGTGTGILAIACKKIWPNAFVVGSDIEEISCQIAEENAQYNDCSDINILYSDGFKSFGSQKFDLIISNILLKPLIDNSMDMMRYLKPLGRLILSGFLKNQEQELLDEFIFRGFKVRNKVYIDEWVAIEFEHPKIR